MNSKVSVLCSLTKGVSSEGWTWAVPDRGGGSRPKFFRLG